MSIIVYLIFYLIHLVVLFSIKWKVNRSESIGLFFLRKLTEMNKINQN